MKLLVFLSMFAAAAAASAFLKPLSSKYDGDWFLFKKAYHKVYEKMKDEFYRRAVWESNIFFINEHNEAADKGKHSYWLGINEYGDLTHEEFVSQFNGFKGNASKATQKSNFETNLLVEESVDWRERGYVTDVKNQGKCGSCWAFSATGALEGQHFKQTRKLVSLSEQNLVDCSGPEGNNGCHGGLMDQAFEYIKVNKGIDTEESYPYEAVEMDCRFKESAVGATDIGFTDVESGSETALKQAAGTVGPISVAINAALSTFRFYKSGVYYGEDCSPEQLDHGVLVVGYGNDQETGKDYWLVKNSWGTSWGEGGYIKMSRNRDNNCGIASKASYPVVRNLNRSDG